MAANIRAHGPHSSFDYDAVGTWQTPPTARIGDATAITPLLTSPLSGSVTFVAGSSTLPDLVLSLTGQLSLTLRGTKTLHLRMPRHDENGRAVAAWLVESKQHVVENMAPVLTMLFTPLFAVMLTVAAAIYAVSGVAGEFDRELLGVFDALLIVVLGLLWVGAAVVIPSLVSTPASYLFRPY